MAGTRRRWTVGMAVFVGLLGGHRLAIAETSQPITIVLLFVNEADVPSNVLSQAQDEASRIYQGLGIRLVWTNPDTERGDYRFTVKILPRTLTGKGIDGRAMGVAPGTREARGTLAFAFYDRIREVTSTIGADLSLILGHVIAHEIGHLLLPYDSHARSGLMRGSWDARQAMRAATGALTFTPMEAALIRKRLQTFTATSTHR